MAAGISAKHLYREAMEQVHSYNSKLLLDRRLRMPYIDNQTGLAQQDCHLWVSRVQRCAPMRKGQIYSYPSRRWMVRKRPDFIGASKIMEKKSAPEPAAAAAATEDGNQDAPQETDKPTVDAVKTEETTVIDTPASIPATAYEDYYDDETFDSELDSDEEFGSRKKKRKTTRSSRSNKKGNQSVALKFGAGDKWRAGKVGEDLYKSNLEEKKKFYDCQFCNKRYKNQQSLRYHYEHHNHNLTGGEQPQTPINANEIDAPAQLSSDQPPPDHVSGAKRKKGMPPSSYCDFCLGSADINKKSGSSEELISCADCGRSGHPSCLQFNENLTEQVKKYKWQCIECKCCCICGTSDNDEQLLFCDDCDRGYHMYCLSPPIAEPPEGSWQCQLCEARVKGRDISKVAVLPQHMDVSLVASMVTTDQVTSVVGPLSSTSQRPMNEATPSGSVGGIGGGAAASSSMPMSSHVSTIVQGSGFMQTSVSAPDSHYPGVPSNVSVTANQTASTPSGTVANPVLMSSNLPVTNSLSTVVAEPSATP